jgi:hypothetical protein
MADTPKNTAAEVGIKLVIDSDAKKATEDLKGELSKFQKWNAKWGEKVGSGLSGGASKLMGLALGGVSLGAAAAAAGLGVAVGAVYKSVDAFQEGAKEAKTIAGALTLIDQKGNDFKDIREYANDVKDELDGVAMSAGVTKQSVTAMFTDIAERGGKSVEGAKALTQQMVMAGRALPGGGEALAEGFSMIEMGVVRARNPIVQVIAATHTLKGSAKAVAKQMQAMTIDKQMEIAEKAIAKMAGKMKDVPLTLGEMKTSIGETIDKVFEETGRPIVEGMRPIVARLQHDLLANSGKLAAAGEMFGNNVGKGLDFALEVMEALFDAFKNNWKDIEGAFNELKDVIEPVFKYIYENRKAFAQTFADIATQLIKAFTWIAKTMAQVYSGIGSVMKLLGKQIPGLGDFIKDEEQRERVLGVAETVKKTGGADKEAAKRAYVTGYMGTFGDEKQFEAQKLFDEQWKNAMDDHEKIMNDASAQQGNVARGNATSFAKVWAEASKANDQSAMNYVAMFLQGNKDVQKALAETGPELLGEGFDKLVDTLKGLNANAVLEGIKKKPDLGVGGKANVIQNFGPVTIKQDFRDQDPDDIAVVFKEELAKAGTNRLQSTFAPAGGF